jgi:hypothetical protein
MPFDVFREQLKELKMRPADCPEVYKDEEVVAYWKGPPRVNPQIYGAVMTVSGKVGWVSLKPKNWRLYDLTKGLGNNDSLVQRVDGQTDATWIKDGWSLELTSMEIFGKTRTFYIPREGKSKSISDCNCDSLMFLSVGHDEECPYYKEKKLIYT